MVWLAVTAICGYLIAVITVRAALAKRWTATKFIAVDVSRWSPAEWVAVVLAIAANAGVIGGTLAAAAGRPGPHLSLSWPWAVAGVALTVAAATLMVRSQLAMGASWRIGVDHHETTALVTTGPFHTVRNPIYSSMAAFAAGVTLLVPTAAVGAGCLTLLVFIEWQVRAVEEPFLARNHGEDYAHWTLRAGRFLPRIGTSR